MEIVKDRRLMEIVKDNNGNQEGYRKIGTGENNGNWEEETTMESGKENN